MEEKTVIAVESESQLLQIARFEALRFGSGHRLVLRPDKVAQLMPTRSDDLHKYRSVINWVLLDLDHSDHKEVPCLYPKSEDPKAVDLKSAVSRLGHYDPKKPSAIQPRLRLDLLSYQWVLSLKPMNIEDPWEVFVFSRHFPERFWDLASSTSWLPIMDSVLIDNQLIEDVELLV